VNTPLPARLILASSSTYRQQMLQRLHLPFEVISPDVDESPTPDETPAGLARRLALGKAQAVASRLTATDAVVIGADQVLELDGQPLGKPGDLPRARSQLKSLSGQCVTFHSAVSVISSAGEQISVVPCRATFRTLDDQQIERYLTLETPFDTAGSAKAEGLGISLLARLQSDDPTAIIGLPLIALTQMLIKAGLDPLNFAQP
jgi:septum formation protein